MVNSVPASAFGGHLHSGFSGSIKGGSNHPKSDCSATDKRLRACAPISKILFGRADNEAVLLRRIHDLQLSKTVRMQDIQGAPKVVL